MCATPRKPDRSWNIDLDEDDTEDSDNEVMLGAQRNEKLEIINKLLSLEGKLPISRKLTADWGCASTKTKRYYTSKIEEVVSIVLETLAPDEAKHLWHALKSSSGINTRYNAPCLRSESSLVLGLVESYNRALDNNTRKTILSVMADKLSFSDLEKLIPNLSRHRYTSARHHSLKYGPDALATQLGPTPHSKRQRVDPELVEHFIEFITSQDIIQDIPFGRRKLHITTGEEIEIPNVVRLLIPSRLVDQYLRVCQETDFKPLGRSTLLKILSESCGASVRKCMKGLDDFLAEGTKAFDVLKEVVGALEKEGMDIQKAAEVKEALLESKQYLKGDYKVCFLF